MKQHWATVIALIIGILIGRSIGPWKSDSTDAVNDNAVESENPPVSEVTSNSDEDPSDYDSEQIISDALEFIESIERADLPENGDWADVIRVVDGDTIEIEFENAPGIFEKVRFTGIDTPETVHPNRGIEPFGPEASAVVKSLLEDQRIYLVLDITDRDRYDRLLRYLYTEDGLFINYALVACGLARVTTYPPDVAHVEEYTQAQDEAREAGRGMWGVEITSDD